MIQIDTNWYKIDTIHHSFFILHLSFLNPNILLFFNQILIHFTLFITQSFNNFNRKKFRGLKIFILFVSIFIQFASILMYFCTTSDTRLKNWCFITFSNLRHSVKKPIFHNFFNWYTNMLFCATLDTRLKNQYFITFFSLSHPVLFSSLKSLYIKRPYFLGLLKRF